MRISVLLIFLSVYSCTADEKEDGEICTEGAPAAEKCQKKIQIEIDTTVPFLNASITLCCHLAYGVDCMYHNAIPLCESKSERRQLIEANENFFIETSEKFGVDCNEFRFVNRKLPDECIGYADPPDLSAGIPMPDNSDDSGLPVAAIVVPIIALLLVLASIIYYTMKNRSERRGRSGTTIRHDSNNINL